jgi:PPK2 family polyphosphate:nucleotide phosphotransferase
MAGETDIADETRARKVRKLLQVQPGSLDLTKIDPASTPGLPTGRPDNAKAWSKSEVIRLGAQIGTHHARLYAAAATGAARWRVLLVLQAMDCGGKDGTVKSVVGAMDPLGVRITAFGPPTPDELARHFLWRIHAALPPVGFFGVFNRSHYEDVLAVRVRKLVPKSVWSRRYDEINGFEKVQADDGMTIVKVMLHISKQEQAERLMARLDDPAKRWKFSPGDIEDRERWDAYQAAYTDALNRCSTRQAPWYVVPADRKWYRNWAVANILLAHLAEFKADYPPADFDVEAQREALKANGR